MEMKHNNIVRLSHYSGMHLHEIQNFRLNPFLGAGPAPLPPASCVRFNKVLLKICQYNHLK